MFRRYYLEKLLDRKPMALSGGQRQRVAMGRAIVRNPLELTCQQELQLAQMLNIMTQLLSASILKKFMYLIKRQN